MTSHRRWLFALVVVYLRQHSLRYNPEHPPLGKLIIAARSPVTSPARRAGWLVALAGYAFSPDVIAHGSHTFPYYLPYSKRPRCDDTGVAPFGPSHVRVRDPLPYYRR